MSTMSSLCTSFLRNQRVLGNKSKASIQYFCQFNFNLQSSSKNPAHEANYSTMRPNKERKAEAVKKGIVLDNNSKKDLVKELKLPDPAVLAELGINDPTSLFLRTVTAVTVYNHLHYNYLVPGKFVVPENNMDWPESTWGLALGVQYQRLLYKNPALCVKKREFMHRYGIPTKPILAQRSERILLAMETYMRVFKVEEGKLRRIPKAFRVPQDDRWPRSVWGMLLGRCAQNIALKSYFLSSHDKFKELGLRVRRRKVTRVAKEEALPPAA